jgi:O-antigen/teichoic acid export membrane protein
LFVVVIKWGALGKMLATLLVGILLSAYCLFSYRDVFKISIDYSRIKPIIKYSFPLVLAGTLGFFTTGFDKVLLERQKDLYSLGIYSVAVQMSGFIDVFATAIKTTFQPDIYQAISEKNMKRLTKTILLNVGLVSIIVFLFILFCPILIHLLTAGRYDASTGLARILSLSVITSTIYYQISQATYGSGLSNLTLINKIIGSVLSALLFIVMIPQFGAIGAAWSMVLSFLIYATGNVILLYINRNKFLK